MLIDDEADNASVNTKDEDSQPAAINACIRRLLNLFSKTTYLGVTATPFANIFIDSDKDDDLFPADFIYALSAPTNYIGADRIFGENSDSDYMLQEIDIEKFESCFPSKHKKDFIVESLPDDLYEASYYFLLFNAIRDYRGDTADHRSMMVHISLYTNVQNQIQEMLNMWLDQVKSDVRNYAKLSLSQSEQIESIKCMHAVWDKYNLSKIVGIEWDVLLKKYLHNAISPIEVRAVNMKTGAASLDYFNHKSDGLRVIAIGGNSMSRGLTLEGLGVTYFHRNTKMYDTLLQMGRWFGYRPNYGDVAKIWMTPEAIDWYGQITNAAAELKEEILKMRNANQTPSDFGLKVRQDPGALIVTARNKMRNATDLTCPVSVSGNLLETPRLKASRNILSDNEMVFKKFLNSLNNIGVRFTDSERTKGHYYWKNVPGENVAQLLLDFETNPWHLSFNGRALAEFIESHQWDNGWDVVLIRTGSGVPYDGVLQCGDERLFIEGTEKRKILADNKMISVSGTKLRVGSGGCTRIGLTEDEIQEVKKEYASIPGNEHKQNIPDKAYLISNRDPLLMLHVIQADYSKAENKDLPEFLFALGVGFPRTSGITETVNYKVNLIELRNWVDIYDNYEDEDI